MENPLSFDSAGATRQGSVVYIVDLQPAVLATSVYTQLKLFAQRPIEAEHIWQTFTGACHHKNSDGAPKCISVNYTYLITIKF